MGGALGRGWRAAVAAWLLLAGFAPLPARAASLSDGGGPAGELLAASFDGELCSLAATGTVLGCVDTGLDLVVDIELGPDGTLYALTGNSLLAGDGNRMSLFVVDPVDGTATKIGSTGLVWIAEGDLAWDPVSGTLLGVQADDVLAGTERQIFSIDVATGAATILGTLSTGNPARDLSGLAFGPGGTLYALDTLNEVLLTIDPATWSSASEIALSFPDGGGFGTLAGLAAGPGGTLLVADGGVGGGDALWSVDPATGEVALLGPTRAGGFAGLVVIPEPGTAALLAVALAALALRRR